MSRIKCNEFVHLAAWAEGLNGPAVPQLTFNDSVTSVYINNKELIYIKIQQYFKN